MNIDAFVYAKLAGLSDAADLAGITEGEYESVIDDMGSRAATFAVEDMCQEAHDTGYIFSEDGYGYDDFVAVSDFLLSDWSPRQLAALADQDAYTLAYLAGLWQEDAQSDLWDELDDIFGDTP